MIDLRKIERLPRSVTAEQLRRKDAQAVIDVFHFGSWGVLVVFDDPPLEEEYIAFVPTVVVPQYGHERGAANVDERLLHKLEIAGEERVPIKHKELLTQQWQRMFQCASRPKQGRPIRRV